MPERLRSDEQLRGLAESALDAVITINEAGRIAGWNRQAAATFGWSAEEAIGRTLSETIVPPELRNTHEEGLRRFIAGAGGTLVNRRVQITAQRRDGTRVPVELSVTAEATAEGLIYHSFVRDITDRARADAGMAERARQLKLLAEVSVELNHAPEFGESMSIVAQRARELIGAHQAVVHASIDGSWTNVTTAQSLSERHGGVAAIHTQVDESAAYALDLKDRMPMRMTQADLQAHPAWLDLLRRPSTYPPLRGLLSAPLIAGDGQHVGLIQLSDRYAGDFTADDESLLVQLAQAASAKVENLRLLKSSHDLRAFHEMIMESTPSGICAVNTTGLLTLVNRRLCELSGYTAAELTGKPAAMLFDPEDISAIRRWFARVILDGTPVSGDELTLVRKDGSRRRVRIRMGPLKEGDHIVGAAGSVEDITEAQRLQEHVLRAQQIDSLGRLAGGVAHDFANLMTIIIGHIELDIMSPPAADVLKRDLEEIHETAQRAAGLAQQLLAFSRRQPIEPRLVAVADLIRDSEFMLRRVAGGGVRLEVSCAAGTGCVRVDRNQFELVLVNLALNARDAMPDGGSLRIEASAATVEVAGAAGETESHGYAVISVTDSGIGMTDEVKQHLFEPFYTTKPPGQGTGLGLATCYGVVKQLGGEVWVESEAGRGTTVRIYLPAAAHDGAALQSASNGSALPAGDALPAGNEAILLAEDEPLVRRLASRVLTGLGYAVFEAANGDEALNIALTGVPVDLLLTDVAMPGMGGQLLSDAARALHPGLRVLYMSGYTDDADVRRGLSDRAIDFLPKPFSPGVLATKVRQVLDAPPRTA